MRLLSFRPRGRWNAMIGDCNGTTLDLLFLKQQIYPSKCLGARYLIEELPIDPKLIPLMHLNSFLDFLVGD
jgi:hypothetical protein